MLYKEDFGEGKNIEFKREIPKRHEKLLKDVIAFSNSTGGKIFIGIEDKTNEVIGIGEKNPFRLADDISNMIFDSCTPIIDPEITMISNVTALNIKTVIESFSGEEVFGRKEIKERLGYKGKACPERNFNFCCRRKDLWRFSVRLGWSIRA